MEGVLRVHWGVRDSIRLKEYDDKRVIVRKKTVDQWRGRKCKSMSEGIYLIYKT